jgi:hypothetical protein
LLKSKSRAQSIIEYVILFTIVGGAIALTHRYLYRSVNAKLKQVQEELNYRRGDWAISGSNASSYDNPVGGDTPGTGDIPGPSPVYGTPYGG